MIKFEVLKTEANKQYNDDVARCNMFDRIDRGTLYYSDKLMLLNYVNECNIGSNTIYARVVVENDVDELKVVLDNYNKWTCYIKDLLLEFGVDNFKERLLGTCKFVGVKGVRDNMSIKKLLLKYYNHINEDSSFIGDLFKPPVDSYIVCISNDAMHQLSSSYSNYYSSCFNCTGEDRYINGYHSYNGCYRGSNIWLMRDKHSVIIKAYKDDSTIIDDINNGCIAYENRALARRNIIVDSNGFIMIDHYYGCRVEALSTECLRYIVNQLWYNGSVDINQDDYCGTRYAFDELGIEYDCEYDGYNELYNKGAYVYGTIGCVIYGSGDVSPNWNTAENYIVSDYYTCNSCGCCVSEDDRIIFDDESYCSDCVAYCDNCNEYFRGTSYVVRNYGTFCSYCVSVDDI